MSSHSKTKLLMYKKIILIHLICLSYFLGLSQNRKDSITYKKRSHITFNPITSISEQTPKWKIGYLQDINSKWNVGIEFGYGNHDLVLFSLETHSKYSFNKAYNLWELRPSLSYHFLDYNKADFYLSLELYYINQTDVLTDGIYLPKNSINHIGYDQTDFQRKKYGFLFLFNFKLREGKRIGLSTYGGVGMKIRSQNFSNIQNPTPDSGELSDFAPFVQQSGYQRVQGTLPGFDMNLGVKLIVKIK